MRTDLLDGHLAERTAPQESMQARWGGTWALYSWVGDLFALPMGLSYVYATILAAWHTGSGVLTVSGFSAVFMLAFWGMFCTALQRYFWLPLLIYWLGWSQDSFWQFIASGFYFPVGAGAP